VLAGVLVVAAVAASAGGGDATASRAQLERWFRVLGTDRALDLATPRRWEYSFVAADGRSLEALSVALVRDGYQIERLEVGPMPTLRMARRELHTPLTLLRRNETLRQVALENRARYVGVDLAGTD
jgi:hypothetical protein